MLKLTNSRAGIVQTLDSTRLFLCLACDGTNALTKTRTKATADEELK